MATKRKKTVKKTAASVKAVPHAAPAKGGEKKGVVRVLIAVVLIICAFEVMNLMQTEQARDFKVQNLLKLTGEDKACGRFTAWGIAPIGKDKFVVTDQEHSRLLVFDRQGNFIRSIGKKGTKPTEFQEPSGMAYDDRGNAYVMDTWNGAIKGFSEDGKPVLDLDLTKFKNFYGPRGISYDGRNFVVADTGNHRVALVSPDDTVVASWGKSGSAEGEFKGPLAAATDGKGNYYVADSDNNRLQWLDANGKVVKVFKYTGGVSAVAVDSQGRFYVASGTDGGTIKAYNPKGKYLGDLKDQNGSAEGLRSARWLSVSSDDVLMLTSGNTAALYQLPKNNP